MISFGLGELGVVVLLALLFFDAKQVGKAARWIRNARQKITGIQKDWKSQLDKLIEEEDDKEELDRIINDNEAMRKWGDKKISSITGADKFQFSQNIVLQLMELEVVKQAKNVALYSALPDEMDTGFIKKKLLEEGKTVFYPYISQGQMRFVPVPDPIQDMEAGVFGIMEPKPHLRIENPEEPDLYLVPGRCFDLWGGRLGRGKGYYDKHLQNRKATKIGIAYDGQISMKKLNLQEHDIPMDYIVTNQRVVQAKKDT